MNKYKIFYKKMIGFIYENTIVDKKWISTIMIIIGTILILKYSK